MTLFHQCFYNFVNNEKCLVNATPKMNLIIMVNVDLSFIMVIMVKNKEVRQ